jgi:hypothetical protein
MTWAELIDPSVRRAISDAVAEYRVPNSALIRYASDGRREIVRQHPEALYVTSIVTTPLTDLTESNLGDTIDIAGVFVSALVDYIAWKVLDEDSEDAQNRQKALTHKAVFDAAMRNA